MSQLRFYIDEDAMRNAFVSAISALQSRGMWLSDAIIQKALHLAGELA